MGTYLSCPRKYWYRYHERLARVDDEPQATLSFGRAVHQALEALYTGVDIDVKCDNEPLFNAVMAGYKARYGTSIYEDVTPVEIETAHIIPIRNPASRGRRSRLWELAIKPDMVGQDGEGNTYIIDHKTTSSISANYLTKLNLELQMPLYSLAFHGPVLKLHNIIRKVALRQKKNESEEDYRERLAARYMEDDSLYHQAVSHITNDSVRHVMSSLWDAVHLISQSINSGYWPMNSNTCTQWFRLCPYFALCESNMDEFVLENLYYIREIEHEEYAD